MLFGGDSTTGPLCMLDEMMTPRDMEIVLGERSLPVHKRVMCHGSMAMKEAMAADDQATPSVYVIEHELATERTVLLLVDLLYGLRVDDMDPKVSRNVDTLLATLSIAVHLRCGGVIKVISRELIDLVHPSHSSPHFWPVMRAAVNIRGHAPQLYTACMAYASSGTRASELLRRIEEYKEYDRETTTPIVQLVMSRPVAPTPPSFGPPSVVAPSPYTMPLPFPMPPHLMLGPPTFMGQYYNNPMLGQPGQSCITVPPPMCRPSGYKTRLCKHFVAGLFCPEGETDAEKCNYAHGHMELRRGN